MIFASQPWSKAGALWGGISIAGVGLTHVLRVLARRHGWLAMPPDALLGRMFAGVLVIATLAWWLTLELAQVVYDARIPPLSGVLYDKLSPGGQLRNVFIFQVLVHGCWVAIYLAVTMQRQRWRTQVSLQQAELRLLKSQLNPHFLFNALNGVRSLIADEPDRARDAVTHLAKTLRYTLAVGDEDLVSLERELEMVEDYLALESLRLAERLRVERDIAAAARTVRLPAMLLQTLVENAIKHGIAELKEGGTLRVGARIDGDFLVLQVTNPRPPGAPGSNPEGVGLRNATERLRLLFGDRGTLRLDASNAACVVAEVRVPA